MARDNDRSWIRRASPCDSANRSGTPNRARHFTVGPRRAVRNATQFLPYAPLKCSGLNIRRQVEMRLSAAQMIHDFRYPLFESGSIAFDVRAGILFPQRRFQAFDLGIGSSQGKPSGSRRARGCRLEPMRSFQLSRSGKEKIRYLCRSRRTLGATSTARERITRRENCCSLKEGFSVHRTSGCSSLSDGDISG